MLTVAFFPIKRHDLSHIHVAKLIVILIVVMHIFWEKSNIHTFVVTHSLHVNAVEALSVHEGRLVDAWCLNPNVRPVDADDHAGESRDINEGFYGSPPRPFDWPNHKSSKPRAEGICHLGYHSSQCTWGCPCCRQHRWRRLQWPGTSAWSGSVPGSSSYLFPNLPRVGHLGSDTWAINAALFFEYSESYGTVNQLTLDITSVKFNGII